MTRITACFTPALTVLALTAPAAASICLEPEPAPPPPDACRPAPALGNGGEARAPYGCDEARVFFVDFPVWGRAPDAAFAGDLAAALDGWANRDPFALCRAAACDPQCQQAARAGLVTEVEAVFPQRWPHAVERRTDGHLRHWRVRFLGADGSGPIALDPSQHCAAVDALRTLATDVARWQGLDADTIGGIRVGREACAISPMSPSAGLFGGQRGPAGGPHDGRPDTTVALVDTGVDARLQGALAVSHEADAVRTASVRDTGARHLHGTALAELIRGEAEPGVAELVSHRVMAHDGTGVVADAARAVDAAVFDGHGATVVNLSLGWLPEQSRARRLTGPGCGTTEDDIGEAMRYALTMAAEADRADRPVAVVIAAGNRPLSGEDPEAFQVEPRRAFDAMTIGWWRVGREPMLMPAEYGRLDRLGRAVGAVDQRDHRSALSVMPPETEPRLVAWGQHVPLEAVARLTGGESQTMTGSSLAAARVSGALARALDALIDRHQQWGDVPRVSAAVAEELLYLTGRPVGRTTWGGAPVRRLDGAQLDQALACDALPVALMCIAEMGDDPAALIAECAPLLARCAGAEPDVREGDDDDVAEDPRSGEACALNPASHSEPANGEPARWADGQDALLVFGDPLTNNTRQRIDRALLGAVGPQPRVPTCADCRALVDYPRQRVQLLLRMSKSFPGGTAFRDPYVLVYDDRGDKGWISVNLAGQVLSPGSTVLATTHSGLPVAGKIVSASLVVTIEQYGKVTGYDTAALTVY